MNLPAWLATRVRELGQSRLDGEISRAGAITALRDAIRTRDDRPAVTKPPIEFTAHDWDMARNVLENRTSGAIDAAKADWAHFEAAYKRVRPLLTDDDMTTADVAEQLAAA